MKSENLKCPDCNGPMTPRNGKFGKFWGCKNYPVCKGTRDSLGQSKDERRQEQDNANEDSSLGSTRTYRNTPRYDKE